MGSRLELQTLFETLMESRNVYFQPPESISIAYPCIVYELSDLTTKHASNLPYIKNRRYSCKLISRSPDPKELDKLSELKHFDFERHFIVDNLHHFAFNIYF